MTSIVELITQLAEKAGIARDSAALTGLLSNNTLQGVQVDDTVAEALSTKLLTVEAAKHNSEVVTHLKNKHYHFVDRGLEEFLEASDYDEGQKLAIKALLASESSTLQKGPKLAAEIIRLEREKTTAKQGDKAELQREIDTLRAKVREENKRIEDLTKTHTEQLNAKELDNTINMGLLGYKFVLPESVPMNIRLRTVKDVLNAELRSKGLVLHNDDGIITLTKADGSKYYDEKSNLVDFRKFQDGVFAQNHLLAATDKNEPTGGKNGVTNRPSTIISEGKIPVNDAAFKVAAQQSYDEFMKGSDR